MFKLALSTQTLAPVANATMAWCASGSESLTVGYATIKHVEAGSFVRSNQPEDPA
jgi:hypothetical protein